jgi:putative transposase
MFPIIFSLVYSIRQGLRNRAALHAEILALRHQLLVLERSNRSRKLRLTAGDRLLWSWLSQLWSGWRPALVIVKPETVIAWHRRGFRLYGSWKSRHPLGRPTVSREVT